MNLIWSQIFKCDLSGFAKP